MNVLVEESLTFGLQKNVMLMIISSCLSRTTTSYIELVLQMPRRVNSRLNIDSVTVIFLLQ